MKIKIVLNKYSYITGYAIIGDIENSIEINYEGETKDLKNYQYVDEKLIYNPIPKKPLGVALEYDGTNWIETATLEEQEKILRENIINKTSELARIQTSGFGDNKLELEIKELREKHKEITHELATQIENIEIVGVVR